MARGYTELIRLARGLLDDQITAVEMAALDLTPHEAREVAALTIYEAEYRRDNSPERLAAERRGKALLRSLLSPRQRREWRSRLCFKVRGSAGGMYRLCPETGAVQGLILWHCRWQAVTSYCLIHPASYGLPRADASVNHLLLLTADEPAFLAEAHARPFWTGMAGYLQRRLAIRYEPIVEEAA